MAASNTPASKGGLYADPREDWLALRKEKSSIRRARSSTRIITFGIAGGQRYLIEEMAQDIACGPQHHCDRPMSRPAHVPAGGPEALRPVGRLKFANGAAAMSASGGYGPAAICAGIVGHVNMLLGEGARGVLEAEIAAGNGRFPAASGIRPPGCRCQCRRHVSNRPRACCSTRLFVRALPPLGLSFDAWLFHPQIGELTALARAFPDTKIALDHCGGPIGIGSYANRRR